MKFDYEAFAKIYSEILNDSRFEDYHANLMRDIDKLTEAYFKCGGIYGKDEVNDNLPWVTFVAYTNALVNRLYYVAIVRICRGSQEGK